MYVYASLIIGCTIQYLITDILHYIELPVNHAVHCVASVLVSSLIYSNISHHNSHYIYVNTVDNKPPMFHIQMGYYTLIERENLLDPSKFSLLKHQFTQ